MEPQRLVNPLATDDHDVLAMVHEGWSHLRLQRPLAAWATWQRVLRLDPSHQAAHQALDALASAEPLPTIAKAALRFWPPDESNRQRWNDCLSNRELDDLDSALEAFAELSSSGLDGVAERNWALCLAWKGENTKAIAVLDLAVQHMALSRFENAVEAWLFAEMLRQGAGAERLADELSHSLSLKLQRHQQSWIETLIESGEWREVQTRAPVVGAKSPNDSEIRTYEWLSRPAPKAEDSPDLNALDLTHVLAIVLRGSDFLRISTPIWDNLKRLELRLPQRGERTATPLPLSMLDAAIWTFRLPSGLDEETMRRLATNAIAHYYEDRWIHAPRIGLDGLTPAEAGRSIDPAPLAKLEAILRFREQIHACSGTAKMFHWHYDFDQLRSKLIPSIESPASSPSCTSSSSSSSQG